MKGFAMIVPPRPVYVSSKDLVPVFDGFLSQWSPLPDTELYMTAEDIATLKARVEQALALSVKAVGTLPRQPADSVRLPMDRCWALVNVESTQTTLTDRAVRALGGTAFTVTVDDTGVTIAPQAAPVPAPSPAPATH